ncbi:hypothetical protein M8J76_008716 [Diaphorina citri]|nr:hypothetical protein M8J75_004129 [Diaphorina citri]KAI5716560.1 hypothetical protein M8J76_008716 [Diaphorina citri]
MVVHTESQTAPGWDSDASQLQGVSNGAGFIQGDRVLKYQQHFDFSLDDEPMIHWTNTFNMRQVTLSNLSGNTLRSMVQRTLNPHIRGRCVMSASKSLDVLRQNLQAAINKDIDAVIQGYLEKYFAPAIHNIRVNLGQTSVSEEHLREVCRSILDEAKLFYSARIGSRGNSPPNDADYAFSKTTCSPRSPLFHGTTRSRKREAEDSNVDTQAQQAKQSRREAPYNVPESKLDPLRFDANSQFMLSTRAQKVIHDKQR